MSLIPPWPPAPGSRTLVGVIHLLPLTGAPLHRGSMAEIIERALDDARVLSEVGFHAAIVENYGDRPFPKEASRPETLTSMTRVVAEIAGVVGLPLGVNVLRNDAEGALAIAAATGAAFIRVNVHTGVVATDQGLIEGRADHTLRRRAALGLSTAIWADLFVKHGVTLHAEDVAAAARDTVLRGGADALILTGPATGQSVDPHRLQRVCEAVPDRPILVGSGATAENLSPLLSLCDGVIVGTGIKRGGRTENPVCPDGARRFAEAAGVNVPRRPYCA